MFEDALVMGRATGSRKSWIVMGSLGVQACVVAALVGVPLLWPAVLPVVSAAPRAIVLVKRAELKPKPQQVVTRTTDTNTFHSTAIARPASITTSTRQGTIARGQASPTAEGAPSLISFGSGVGSMGANTAGPLGTGTAGSNIVVAEAKKTGPLRVSSGVVSGLLLAPITPIYPQLAKATHTSGTVVLRATINKAGRIVGLQVVSGPEMLRRSAVEAVVVARYQPYLLNGEATEVETTISIVFSASL